MRTFLTTDTYGRTIEYDDLGPPIGIIYYIGTGTNLTINFPTAISTQEILLIAQKLCPNPIVPPPESSNITISIKQVEIDFGNIPILNKKIVISDLDINSSNKIIASVFYENDESEWFEDLIIMARAGEGEVTIYCKSPYTDLDGLCKINYIIG